MVRISSRVCEEVLVGQDATSHYSPGYKLTDVTDSSGNTLEGYSYDADGNTTGISRDGKDLSLTYNNLDEKAVYKRYPRVGEHVVAASCGC